MPSIAFFRTHSQLIILNNPFSIPVKPRQTNAEVHGGGCLSNALFLVCDGNHFAIVYCLSPFLMNSPSSED